MPTTVQPGATASSHPRPGQTAGHPRDPLSHGVRQRRPRAVSFVASLLMFEAVLIVLAGGAMLVGAVADIPLLAEGIVALFGPMLSKLPPFDLATIVIVTSGGLLVAGIGLLQLREWSWVLAMALQGFGLAHALYTHLHGVSQYLPLALCSLVVLVLNQREVREAVTVAHEHV